MSNYSIQIHQHRYSMWCAATAARLRAKGKATSVQEMASMLEAIGIEDFSLGVGALPMPKLMDVMLREMREGLITEGTRRGYQFTHGHAGKIIAMYFKTLYQNAATCMHPSVAALHPPIDAAMIKNIVLAKVGDTALWIKAKNKGWSNLDLILYEKLINDLRLILGSVPLWHAEQFWPGYRVAASK